MICFVFAKLYELCLHSVYSSSLMLAQLWPSGYKVATLIK